MISALRGTGLVKPVMTVQLLSILLNVALAPVLIAGWGTGMPLGVAGAGLASTLGGVFSVTTLSCYLLRPGKYVSFRSGQWKPNFAYWQRILSIGLPSGVEIFVLFITMGLMYWLIRDFGSDAQAGYGIGARVMQSIFLPAMAVGVAISPIVGQNFGARRADRVRQTFRLAASTEVALMALIAPMCHIAPEAMIGFFSADPQVIEIGAEYLRIVSWGFVFSGFAFSCSGMFQGLGNTWPGLLVSVVNLMAFAAPAVWMSHQREFQLRQLWLLLLATMALRAVISFWLVRAQMNKRLAAFSVTPQAAAA
jgi:putative MATE family efflux protein